MWSYLQRFTTFNGYEHHVCAQVDGKLLPVPFNLTALEMLFAPPRAALLKEMLVRAYGMEGHVAVADLRAHADPALAELGEIIFQKIYLNYTVKQWGERPEHLDFATITQRVPVRVTYDNRYFLQGHQGLPQDGYTRLFEKMLGHPNIELRLGVDAMKLLTIDETAINDAQLGWILKLSAGAAFQGSFLLPVKASGTGWIIVMLVAHRPVPNAGTRINPSAATGNGTFPTQAAAMPTIITTNLSGLPTFYT